MKKYLRAYLVLFASFFIASNLIPTITFEGGFKTLALATLVLTAFNFFIKPILNLLLLPINLLTLGLFRWFVNVFVFYIMLLIVPQVKIKPFVFPGYSHEGFIIPSLELGFFWTLVLVCFIISFTTGLLYWVFKK